LSRPRFVLYLFDVTKLLLYIFNVIPTLFICHSERSEESYSALYMIKNLIGAIEHIAQHFKILRRFAQDDNAAILTNMDLYSI